MPPVTESLWLWGGVAGYLGGSVAAWRALVTRRSHDKLVFGALAVGAVLLSLAIAERWLRVGYGPFLTLFEILLSNLASLGLISALIFWRFPRTRYGAVVVFPVLLLLGIWILFVPADAGRLPATYETWLLWVHVGVGKVFLAACLVAVGLAARLLLRRVQALGPALTDLPDELELDATIWRLMAIAFVFHSLMLIAGAVWAQDAWGRYWAWDPLETSAFLNWLVLGITLHLRVTWRLPRWVGWWLVIGVFVLAFLTFFGVPFLSAGPHQGIF